MSDHWDSGLVRRRYAGWKNGAYQGDTTSADAMAGWLKHACDFNFDKVEVKINNTITVDLSCITAAWSESKITDYLENYNVIDVFLEGDFFEL